MASYIKVAKASDLRPGQGKMITAGDKRIALFNDPIRAPTLGGRCPREPVRMGSSPVRGTRRSSGFAMVWCSDLRRPGTSTRTPYE